MDFCFLLELYSQTVVQLARTAPLELIKTSFVGMDLIASVYWNDINISFIYHTSFMFLTIKKALTDKNKITDTHITGEKN